MSVGWLVVAGTGAAVLALSILAARRPVIPPLESRVFNAVNGLPDALYVPLWLPMQLGNLVVGLLVGLTVAAGRADARAAVAVVLVTMLKLVVERALRHLMAPWLPVRQRPGTSQPGATLRGGDVPSAGPSFPSGHAILATGVACVATAGLPLPVSLAVVAGAGGAVAVGRVYVGAHNPLDVTAGVGAGLLAGGLLAALVVR